MGIFVFMLIVIVLVFVVMLLIILNVFVSMYVILIIVGIIFVIIGFLVFSGWRFNILEFIIMLVVVGVFIDFVMYYGVVYCLVFNKECRKVCVEYFFFWMGFVIIMVVFMIFIVGKD